MAHQHYIALQISLLHEHAPGAQFILPGKLYEKSFEKAKISTTENLKAPFWEDLPISLSQLRFVRKQQNH
jgi:hypothetical protein